MVIPRGSVVARSNSSGLGRQGYVSGAERILNESYDGFGVGLYRGTLSPLSASWSRDPQNVSSSEPIDEF